METKQSNIEYSVTMLESINKYEKLKQKEKKEIAGTKTKKKNIISEFSYSFVKRIFDIIAGIVGGIIMLPIIVVVYVLNKVNKENGPIFYEQLRIGKDGKYFRIYKFRSMVVGADKILKEYLETHPKEKEEFEKYRKLENDPRITKTGKFLRKTSLDELPQCFNLLNNTMSLIGPRPIVDGEIDNYGENRKKFLSAKPGLTGYWQVNGRSNTNYEERMKMELYYVDNKSLWLDIKIFLKTFKSVFKKEGAK